MVTRNQRRRSARIRNALRETDKANSEAVLERRAIVNRNLSSPKRYAHSGGQVSSVYSGAAKSLGYSTRKSVSQGVAPLPNRQKTDWCVRGNQRRD